METNRKNETGNRKGLKAVRCAVFLLLLIAMIFPFAHIVRQVKFRYNRSMFPSFYAQPENSIDIITIGSSADYQYFDTPVLYEKFGYTSYNLSTALQPPAAASFIMTEAEKTQSPALYVVEAREFLHLSEKNRVRALYCVTDSMDLSLNKWNMICHGYEELPKRLSEFFDFTKYHGNWDGVTGKQLKYWDNRNARSDKSWSNNSKVKAFEEPEPSGGDPMPLPEHNEKELLYLLEECKKHGREVLFVANPYVYDEKFERRLPTMQAIVESYGYHFLDLSRGSEYGLDYSTDFYNRNHVNMWGAEKVTIALGEYIEKEYNIETQHSDAVMEDWDSFALSNRKKVEKKKKP